MSTFLNDFIVARLTEKGWDMSNLYPRYDFGFAQGSGMSFNGHLEPGDVLARYKHELFHDAPTGAERVRCLRDYRRQKLLMELAENFDDPTFELAIISSNYAHERTVRGDGEIGPAYILRGIEDSPNLVPDEISDCKSWDEDDWFEWHESWVDYLTQAHYDDAVAIKQEAEEIILASPFCDCEETWEFYTKRFCVRTTKLESDLLSNDSSGLYEYPAIRETVMEIAEGKLRHFDARAEVFLLDEDGDIEDEFSPLAEVTYGFVTEPTGRDAPRISSETIKAVREAIKEARAHLKSLEQEKDVA